MLDFLLLFFLDSIVILLNIYYVSEQIMKTHQIEIAR